MEYYREKQFQHLSVFFFNIICHYVTIIKLLCRHTWRLVFVSWMCSTLPKHNISSHPASLLLSLNAPGSHFSMSVTSVVTVHRPSKWWKTLEFCFWCWKQTAARLLFYLLRHNCGFIKCDSSWGWLSALSQLFQNQTFTGSKHPMQACFSVYWSVNAKGVSVLVNSRYDATFWFSRTCFWL